MANAKPIRTHLLFADDKSIEIRNATLKGVVINTTDNTLTNVNIGNFAANVILTAMPVTPNDTTLLTSKAIADYVTTQIVTSGSIGRPTGTIDMTSGTANLPASATGGEYWYVAGLTGEAEGLLGGVFKVTNGDMVISINPSAGGTGSTVAADFMVQQTNTINATETQYGTVMYAAVPTGEDEIDFATALSMSTVASPRLVQYIVYDALHKLRNANVWESQVFTVPSLTSTTYTYATLGYASGIKETIDVKVFDANGYQDNMVSVIYGETGITIECATPIVDAKVSFNCLAPHYDFDTTLGINAWRND